MTLSDTWSSQWAPARWDSGPWTSAQCPAPRGWCSGPRPEDYHPMRARDWLGSANQRWVITTSNRLKMVLHSSNSSGSSPAMDKKILIPWELLSYSGLHQAHILDIYIDFRRKKVSILNTTRDILIYKAICVWVSTGVTPLVTKKVAILVNVSHTPPC